MNLSAIDILILALAAWRLAYLAVHEDAPFRLMARIRARTTFGGVLDCIYCSSVWAAVILLLVWFTPLIWLVYVLAISGAALMLATYTGVRRP